MGFYDPQSGIIDISTKEIYIGECFDKDGIDYREKVKPECITITHEPTEIPASPTKLFYSDGTAKGRIVPAGTILSGGKLEIKKEIFEEQYEPYIDEAGNVIENMYIRINPVRILKNPFGRPIVKTNPNGYIIAEGDSECYLVCDSLSSRYGYSIITSEQLENGYVLISKKSKTKK